MKRILLTSLYVLIFITSFGQAELKSQFEKATDYLKKGNYKNAIKEFSAILDKTTETRVKKFALIYRGFAKNGLNEFSSAITDFDKAIELDPDDLATYIDRGKSKIYAGNNEAAIKDFEFVLTRDSVNEQGQGALFYLANIAYKAGEFELSIKNYDKLILLTPEDAEVYFNRGVSKGMIMDRQGSIKDYDKAIELNPDYKEAYANRGVAKINLLTTGGNIKPTKEQTKDACADLQKAKQLGDNTVDDMIFIYCGK
jgi:tetratricopeptide (TPR) repeat protein